MGNSPLRAAMLVLATLFPGLVLADDGCGQMLYRLSFAGVHLDEKERLVGFDLKLAGAAVQSLTAVPAGWHVVIDNDPGWQGKLSGDISIGAAALSPDNRGRLQITVAKCDEYGPPFGITGEASVTTDYQTYRTIPLDMKSLNGMPQ